MTVNSAYDAVIPLARHLGTEGIWHV